MRTGLQKGSRVRRYTWIHTQPLCSSTRTSFLSFFFYLKQSHKPSWEDTCTVLYSTITCKQSTCLRGAKHGADVKRGKFLNACVQQTIDHYMQPIYDSQNLYPSKQESSVAHASVVNTAVNYNQQMSHICLISCLSGWGRATHPTKCFVSNATE